MGLTLLALDTATEACSAAVLHEGRVVSRFATVGRDHTQNLLPMVQAVMQEAGLRFAALDGLVCGVGPGSFAGVRIAVAFTKGIALAHELKVLGVSSLAMLAQGAISEHAADTVLTAIDARMGEVYWGCYRAQRGLAVAQQPERVCAPQAALLAGQRPDHFHAAGSGWPIYAAELAEAVGGGEKLDSVRLPDARHALTLGRASFESGEAFTADALQPTYLRNNVALTLVQQAALRAR